MTAPLLALWVLAAAGPGEVVVTGASLQAFGDAGVTWASGGATLEAEGLWVDAELLVYDAHQEALTAVGQVVVRVDQGSKAVFLGEVLAVRLERGQVQEVDAVGGRGTLRTGVDAATLAAAHTAAAAEKAGTVQALLLGNRFLHRGSTWTAERVELTPCECDFANPSWGIDAPSATVDTEAERVSITSPVVRVKQVPVLWLPWLSLPLTSRQTGLLFPRPGYAPLNGFTLEQPVFITLGRSADLTLTPGLATGGSGLYGLAGPRLGTELRYAPSSRAAGRLFLGLVYDLRAPRDPLDAALTGQGTRGLRGELGWTHQQDLDHGLGVRVDLTLHSDGLYFRDVTPDVIASTQGFLRSTALAFHRTAGSLLTLEAVLRQDLSTGHDLLGTAAYRASAATPAFGPGTLQRLPALSLALPLRPLAGPLSAGLGVEYARLAPLFSLTGDEGQAAGEGSAFLGGQELSWACQADRLYGTGNGDCAGAAKHLGMGDRRWQPGEREARDRLMLVPRLQLSGEAFGAVALSAAAWWRQLGWAGEASGRLWQRGALVLDGRVETEASRSFGAWRHTVTPSLQVRAVPVLVAGGTRAGDEGPVAYDEVDGAAPPAAGAVQGLAELRQRLVRAGSGDAVRLDLSQGVWLAGAGVAPGPGETAGRLAVEVGWVRAAAAARLDPVLGRFTRLQASAGLDDRRGHGASLGYEELLDDGTDRSRAPLDLLFGLPVPATANGTAPSRARLLQGAAFWSFGWLSLRYEVLLLTHTWAPGLSLGQHALSVGLSPACDCWRLEVGAVQRTGPSGTLLVPDFGATLTVARFGSIGTR